MRILIGGSSGLIGSALVDHLSSSGHDVVRLVRKAPGDGELEWSPADGVLDPGSFDGVDGVINLGGVGIGDEPWTDDRKRLIMSSRVDATTLLATTMAGLEHKPAVFISASAIGIYGDRGDESLDESSDLGPGDDFVVQVAKAWEEAAAPAAAAGVRTVLARSGIVLADDGGALGSPAQLLSSVSWPAVRMLLPYRLGVGGRLGNGRQWWSWITLEDEVRAIEHLLTSDLEGPVNLTAPNPVTNAEFIDALGDALNRPTVIPVPRAGLEILFGKGRAQALIFTSARVAPTRLLESGFSFSQSSVLDGLESALS